MITSRYSLSTLSHQNRLIVAAGGIVGVDRADQVHRTDIVEIYSSTEGKWLSTKRLPFPRSDSPVVIIQEKCFILGGATAETSLSHITTFEDVETLLLHTTAKEKGSTLKTPRWRKLPAHHPLTSPSSVELNQRLLTTGGSWLKDETGGGGNNPKFGTKFVSFYDFETDVWVECENAELPVPLYRSGAVKLSEDTVMVVGGQFDSKQFSATAFIGTQEKP